MRAGTQPIEMRVSELISGVRATLAQQGLEWVGSSPADFEAFMSAEARRWNDLVIAQKLSFG